MLSFVTLLRSNGYSQYHIDRAPEGVDGKEAVMSAVVAVMARVNSIFLREIGVYFELITNNDNLFCIDGVHGACKTQNANIFGKMENFFTINGITKDDYDIGHAFLSDIDAGRACLNSLCADKTKYKGFTGLIDPIDDIFAVDYVSHELGHQLGARHTMRDCGGIGRN